MSDLRVALVAEGPTDTVIIEAALRSILPNPFILTQLQPEQTLPRYGTGWGGVLRWCQAFANRGYASFHQDPTLTSFDLLVLHIDSDVTQMAYADVDSDLTNIALEQNWPDLPNGTLTCPPAASGTNYMRQCLLSWCKLEELGSKSVFCVPSQASEAWLVAAVFDDGHQLLSDLECRASLSEEMERLPKPERIKKTQREYRQHAFTVTKNWPKVESRCTQAARFSCEIAGATQ
jgi:hypothetical protein